MDLQTNQEIKHSYVPNSTLSWFCFHWFCMALLVDVLRNVNINRNMWKSDYAPRLAQSVLATLHTLLIMVFCCIYWNRDLLIKLDEYEKSVLVEKIGDISIGFSVSYFAFDMFCIFIIDFQKQYSYILHHLLAIFIGCCMSKMIVSLDQTANYMFVIEFSNLFISVWYVLREIRKENKKIENKNIKVWVDRISMLFAATYVPARTIGLTVVTYGLLFSVDTAAISGERGWIYWTLTGSAFFILAMSFWFSYKVALIGWSAGLKHFASFECVSYIVKIYVQIFTLLKIVPWFGSTAAIGFTYIVSFMDFDHVAASLHYWSTWHQRDDEKMNKKLALASSLDMASIVAKIAVNGICIYGSIVLSDHHGLGPIQHLLWTIANIANGVFLIKHLVEYVMPGIPEENKAIQSFQVRETKPFLIHYFLSAIVPVLLTPDAPRLSIVAYLVGGITWTLGFNCGILHLAVIVGDMTLILWFNR